MTNNKGLQQSIAYLTKLTRSIPDHPKPGIMFRDLTTVFQDERGMELALGLMAAHLKEPGKGIRIYDKLVGIESRGFILAGGLSGKLGGGVVMARKPGKLPFHRNKIEYTLEYGTDALEMHRDAIHPGERIVVVDDLLATGGTADAACRLVEMSGGRVVKVIFLVELPELGGRRLLERFEVEAIYGFSGH